MEAGSGPPEMGERSRPPGVSCGTEKRGWGHALRSQLLSSPPRSPWPPPSSHCTVGETEVYIAVAAPQRRHLRSLARAPPSPGHPEPSPSRATTVPASSALAQGGPSGPPGLSPPRPPPGRVPEAGSRHQRPPDAPALGQRSAPSLAAPQALGRRPLSLPTRDVGTLARSACGSPGPRGPPAPLRPASAAPAGSTRARGPGRTGAAPAPAPGPRALAPSPRRLPRAPSGPVGGRPGGVRAAPPDRAGEPAARPSCPRARRRRGADHSPRTGRRSGGKRHSGCAPEGGGPRRPRSRPHDPGRPPATPDPRPPLTCCSSAGTRGLGVAGAPAPPAGAPRRRLPAPRGPRPAPPPARPAARGAGAPRAAARAPRAPSTLPAPASAQATCPVPSDDSLVPGRRPALAPLRREVPGAPAPCHRVANGKCPVPGAPRSFPRRPFRKEKAQPQTRVLGAGPQPCPPSLSPAGPALVQDATL